MKPVFTLPEITGAVRQKVGGKAYALSLLYQKGFSVPESLCVSTDVYRDFVFRSGISERIMLLLNRKSFHEMRWEEIWDLALRIRNIFLTTEIPAELDDQLRSTISPLFHSKQVVVRSSAPGEDSQQTSFAGLHESFINIKGIDAIIDHIKLVWASLWSNRALLYRKELGLDITKSKMAVIIQEIILGEKSGVGFSKKHDDPSVAVIEAVYGLNQGLVDGSVEPDRWIVNRDDGRIMDHKGPLRKEAVFARNTGIGLTALDPVKTQTNPLNHEEVDQVYRLIMKLETLFGQSQDVEWTFEGDHIVILQSRPITTMGTDEEKDSRRWYLSLQGSLHNLEILKKRITEDLIPAMNEEALELSSKNLSELSNQELADEISHRQIILAKWEKVYWDNFIPFAHGIRLFGQIYNDLVKPRDPFEFTQLLEATDMISLRRNNELESLALMLKQNPHIMKFVKNDQYEKLPQLFAKKLDDYLHEYSLPYESTVPNENARRQILKLLIEMTKRGTAGSRVEKSGIKNSWEKLLVQMDQDQRKSAKKILDLARTSYQMRDDDNIYLGKIEKESNRAYHEGKTRVQKTTNIEPTNLNATQIAQFLKGEPMDPVSPNADDVGQDAREYNVRQIQGQPASPGIAVGKARVMTNHEDLFQFKSNEILVCDAIDPNMTFITPLAAGIVERRGGMLIHGAIIAREYEIPCVTGVPDATKIIATGDVIAVDGHLGIVTINK